MTDVYVTDCSYGGIYHYIVMVDGEPYDNFTSTEPLTWSQQWDVAGYYREALER